MNGQLDHLILEATDRLAEQGSQADLRDVMLAGFGYMVYEIRKPKSFLEDKKLAGVGAVIGGIFVGTVEIVLRILGV